VEGGLIYTQEGRLTDAEAMLLWIHRSMLVRRAGGQHGATKGLNTYKH
jgi:hypothetical protein